ncbi:uncharacterized protein EURHEDRAFT_400914 [Aspergillus ruber CBS 135680]|uniref:YTH1-like RRM domain-containing protein n=1 Tax=Aspergillus ruber (strain CBS 135680) TaxID=1388766 RepID=A0A017SK75_ASPRC|nr:uncharacterized protein EURHEDRAFT_400914 [Aspergillus ruber CBS 135680]EYE97156.1 hypothetical protein EURHEDRAFT_400914 [Aspergillus ruber CBS 135680]
MMDLRDHFSQDATDDIERVFLIHMDNRAFVNYRSAAACAAVLARLHDSIPGCASSVLAPMFCRNCSTGSCMDKYLGQAYLFSGHFTAIRHFCEVLGSVFSSDPSTSFSRTYVPSPSEVVPDTARAV